MVGVGAGEAAQGTVDGEEGEAVHGGPGQEFGTGSACCWQDARRDEAVKGGGQVGERAEAACAATDGDIGIVERLGDGEGGAE